jgi:hypothetical protein
MTVIPNKQLKFIHVPRTGGTTIENCGKDHGYQFGRFDGIYCHNTEKTSLDIFGKKPALWHCKLKNDSNLLKSFVFFAVIRNPYERFMSEYYGPRGGSGTINIDYYTGDSRPKNHIIEKYNNETIDIFNTNVYEILNKLLSCDMCCGHFGKQQNYLSNNREDYLLCFDNLQENCNVLFKQHNMSCSLEKTKLGQSIEHKYSIKDLSTENYSLLQTIYNNDYEIYMQTKKNNIILSGKIHYVK